MSSFYAVAKGIKVGVYTTWEECKTHTEGYDNPIFKKFKTIEEATEFIEDFTNNLYVYTDGACINNGSKEARAGIGIYFSKDNPNNVSRELNGKCLTNNVAELTAVIEAISIIKSCKIPNKIIVTDSNYAILCATTYGYKLEKKEWKVKEGKKIPNLDLIKILFELTNEFEIKYQHIKAHTGNKDKHSIGNYYADLLANQSINNQQKSVISNPRIYLKVKYANKDEAKAKGARWDVEKKLWYIYEDNSNKTFLLSKFS